MSLISLNSNYAFADVGTLTQEEYTESLNEHFDYVKEIEQKEHLQNFWFAIFVLIVMGMLAIIFYFSGYNPLGN